VLLGLCQSISSTSSTIVLSIVQVLMLRSLWYITKKDKTTIAELSLSMLEIRSKVNTNMYSVSWYNPLSLTDFKRMLYFTVSTVSWKNICTCYFLRRAMASVSGRVSGCGAPGAVSGAKQRSRYLARQPVLKFCFPFTETRNKTESQSKVDLSRRVELSHKADLIGVQKYFHWPVQHWDEPVQISTSHALYAIPRNHNSPRYHQTVI